MSTAKKFKPGWDDAAYIMRADPERVKKPRQPAAVIKLPKRIKFDAARAIQAWRAIGVEVTEKRIREHMGELKMWERRK